MSNRVKNKVGLITGAAQGLGKEMARLLIEEGAQIVMTDINEELLKKSCLLYTSPSPRDDCPSRMPSSA